MTAAYGGQLRASLLSPDFGPPINTIRDIVDSGIKWKVVDYGDTAFQAMAGQDGYETLMEEKENVAFQDFPFQTASEHSV